MLLNSLHICAEQPIFLLPIIIFSASSAPREERCLLLESLGESVSKIAELFWSPNMAPGSEIPEWMNVLPLVKRITIKYYKNYLSTNTLGIWTSCRGLLPSFRAWLRFKILKKNNDDCGNEYKSHLTPHHTHLLFKHQPVEAFVSLKNILQFWEGLIIFCRCHFNWPQRVCEGRHRCPGQSSCHSTCPTPGPLSHGRRAPNK